MTPFDRSGKSVLKTLWEKEKLLVQAISPFPAMFFTLTKAEIIIFVTFNLSSTNAFNSVCSKILSYGNGLNYIYRTTPCQTYLRKKAFENIVGKGENADKQHLLLCSQCFLTRLSAFSSLLAMFPNLLNSQIS